MKKILFFIIAALLALSVVTLQADNKKDILAIEKLFKQGKIDDALAIAEERLKKTPDSSLWLMIKSSILMEKGQFEQALKIAFHLDKIENQKNIRTSQHIAWIYLRKKDKDKALKWLEETVKRGYLHFEELQLDPLYQTVRDDKRFQAIVEKAKSNIGLGKPVKDFVAQSMDGEKVSLSQLKDKVVLLDFWATWCPPCVRELPRLKKLYDEYKSQGFEIIGISMDFSLDNLNKVLKENKVDWPMIYSGKGKRDEICLLYNVNSAPSFWLVDKKGILRYCGIRADELEKVIAQLIVE